MTGEYQHSLDSKGRMFMPSRLRDDLGDAFYVCKGLEGCLFVYSEENWKSFEDKMNALALTQSIKMRRMIFSTAYKCEPDAQGRILLSQKLREYAGIDKSATVVGVGNHAEIWSSEKWKVLSEEQTEETLGSIMDELGF